MEFNRRVSDGRLAELLGPALLDADRLVRTLGIRRAAQRDWQRLGPGTRDLLTAYVQGINAFIAGHRDRLPLEFTLLGDAPGPWTPIDVLAWSKMMAFSLGQNHVQEVMRYRLAARLGEAAALRLMPPSGGPLILDARTAVAPAAAPPAAGAGAGGGGRSAAAGGGRPAAAAETPWPPAARFLGWPAFRPGSNAWVVHGSRTASGRPLLANDTHLGLSMPSPWYENGLHGGRFDLAGLSLPGVPLVLIGHNARIGWGISNMCGDVQDVYAETRNARGQLLGPGGWYDPRVIVERIPVKGGAAAELRVVVSRHGPILNDVEEVHGAPPLALRWTALDGTRLLDAVVALDAAGDWPSFRAALSLWGAPALNFVYADVAGNIGYQAAGRIPLRAPGDPGMAPVPGETARYDWRGDIPWEGMPNTLNPRAGFIVTANNKVVGEDYPYHIAFDYADPYRAQRLIDLLTARPRLTVDEAQRLQTETYSLPAAALRPYLLAVQPASDRERRALAQVRAWDLRFTTGSAGATIYYAWYVRVLRGMIDGVVDAAFLRDYPGVAVDQTPLYVRLLAEGRASTLDDRRPLGGGGGGGRDALVARAFRAAVADLAARLGGDPEDWRWGRVHTAFLAQEPLGESGIAVLERLFNGRPVPLAGDAFSPEANTPSLDPAHPYRSAFGVTQRQILDFRDLGRSLAINSTGQSGQLFHPHREDQVEPWSRGEYRTLPFSRDAVETATRERLTLVPR
jgi:penicillin amidase